MKKVKCWGIPYGLTSKKDQTEQITIEMPCRSIKEFKQKMTAAGHKLTGKPYLV